MITPISRVDDALDALLRAQLVRSADSARPGAREQAFWFKHVLIQDTALSTLLKGEHKRLHLLVARSIEWLYAAQLDEYVPQLAQHYAFTDEYAQTLDYATRAGDAYMRVYACDEAIVFYQQGLAAAEMASAGSEQWEHLYTQMGRAHELQARYEDALRVYDAMEQNGRARGDMHLALYARLARVSIYGTPTPLIDPDKAEQLATEALESARELGDRPGQAKALWLRMLVNIRSWHPQQGIPDGEASLAIARELGLVEQEAYALHDLASSYMGMGNYARGLVLVDEARALWRQLDNKPMLADSLGSAANNLIFTGRLDEVIQLSDEAFRISESIGNLWGESYSLMNVGQAHEERGDFTLALKAMTDCIDYAEKAGFIVPQIQTRAYLAGTLLYLGADMQARAVAEHALTFFTRQAALHPITLTLHLRLLVNAGRLDEAEDAYRIAAAQLNALETKPNIFELYTLHAQIDLYLARREYAQALPLLDEILLGLHALGINLYLPEAYYNKGKALVELGERDAAYEALKQAEQHATEIHSRRMGWQIYAALGDIEAQRGNKTAAQTYRRQAREILDYLVAHMPDEYRESFLNLPAVHAAYTTKARKTKSSTVPRKRTRKHNGS